MDIAIWQALDAAETAGIAATLSGLSISASSFMANLAKAQAEKATKSKAEWEDAKKRTSGATPDLKGAHHKIEAAALKDYTDDKSVAEETASAMRRLLYAFALFTANLVGSLTLDPIVDKQALEGGALIAGLSYDQLLPYDVGFSGLTLGAGIVLLGLSARAVFKIIPKFDEAR